MNSRDLKAARQLKQKAKQSPATAPASTSDDQPQNLNATDANSLTSDGAVLNDFIDRISSQLGQPIGDRIAATSLLKGAKLGGAILSGNAAPGDLTKAAMALVFGEIENTQKELNNWEKFTLPKLPCLSAPLPMLSLNGSTTESETYLD